MPDTAGAADLGQPGAPAPEEFQFATPALAAMADAVRALGKKNVEGIKRLALEGVQIPAFQVLQDRLDVLLGMAFDISTPQGQSARLEFDRRFEERIAERIQEMTDSLGKAKLASGAQLSPEQVSALAKEMGGFLRPRKGG